MWWYLSFGEPKPVGWLGAAIVEGDTMIDAARKAHQLCINPGGEVLGSPYGEADKVLPSEFLNVLLTRNDIKAIDVILGGKGELEKIRTTDGRITGVVDE